MGKITGLKPSALCLLIGFWLFSTGLFCLDPGRAFNQYRVEFYDAQDGLPQSSILHIHQTREGYLWLGTYEGLVRFDGLRFTIFNKANTPVLRSHSIHAMLLDRGDRLWVGTSAGLYSFYRGKFTGYTETSGFTARFVMDLHEDADGILWVGTSKGLFRGEQGLFTAYMPESDQLRGVVSGVISGEKGELWLAVGPAGLVRSYRGRLTRYTTQNGLPYNFVTFLFKDKTGRLLAGTMNGLAAWDGERFRPYPEHKPLLGMDIRSIYQDRSGDLWVGTSGLGVYCLRKGEWNRMPLERDSLSSSVRSILEDLEGNLWAGTRRGLFQLRNGKFFIYTSRHGLPAGVVRTLMEDKNGTFWIGTVGKGLVRLKNGKFETIDWDKNLLTTSIWSLAEGRGGSIWFGTYGKGLHHLKDRNIVSYSTRNGLSNNIVRAILVDRSGRVWAGTDGGGIDLLEQGKIVRNYSTQDGLPGNYIYALAQDQGGAVWIGTHSNGLCRFKNGRFTSWQYAGEDMPSITWALYPDSRGTLWIGTSGSGLKRLKDGKIVSITSRNGLHSDLAFQVLEDLQGKLWMNCNFGVFRVDKRQLNLFADGRISRVQADAFGRSKEISFTSTSGPAQPAGWRASDGKLWFPTVKGIAVVDPGNININHIPPSAMIEALVVDGQRIEPAGLPGNRGLDIDAGTRKLDFLYTGISFIHASSVRFKVKLEGYDSQWQDVNTQRRATYMNLEPGAYTFMVKACNSDGKWNDIPRTLQFTLHPFFTQTLLFKVLVSLFLVCAALFIFHWRTRRIKVKMNRESEHKLNLQRMELEKKSLEKELILKRDFTAMLVHDLRSPVNAIMGYARLIKENHHQLDLEKVGTVLERSSGGMSSLIDDMLDLSRFEAGKMKLHMEDTLLAEVLQEAVDMLRPLMEQAHLRAGYLWKDASSFRPVPADRGQVGQVVNNLLANAIHFSPRGSSIGLDIHRETREGKIYQEVCIIDRGPGVPEKDREYLFERYLRGHKRASHKGTGLGLAVSRLIIEAHGGTIGYKPREKGGSVFYFSLPEKE